MRLSTGYIVIQLYPDQAPKHVARIKRLVEAKFYDGLTFHRIIPNLIVQGGCPVGDGTGALTVKIPFEDNDLKHIKGAVSMARGNDKNSASCQFFICIDDIPSLDGEYTVWGKIVSGLNFVEQIAKNHRLEDGKVIDEPDIIEEVDMVMNNPVEIKR
jgi:peptidylprolyl isomerase